MFDITRPILSRHNPTTIKIFRPMSIASPSKQLYHSWLSDFTKLFQRPDNKICVVNRLSINIIAILTSDPNERRAEVKSADVELNLSASLFTDNSATTGLKGSVDIDWSSKTLTKEIRVIPKGSSWIFNTDSSGKHYLTILQGEQKASKFPIIGASSYIPNGYQYIVQGDIPCLEDFGVPAAIVLKGLIVKEDKEEEITSPTSPTHEEKATTTPTSIVKKSKSKATPPLIGCSVSIKPEYKSFFGLKTQYKIDIVNNRSDNIYVVLSSIPENITDEKHFEAVMIGPNSGTKFTAYSKKNELTVVLATDDGDLLEDINTSGEECVLTLRYKKTISIGYQWTADESMKPRKITIDKIKDFM